MRRIPIALQLYSVREECTKDFEGTIKKVSEIGYEGVEFAGYYEKSGKELKGILDKYELKVAGTHIGIDKLMGDELKRTIEFNAILNNKYLIVPSLPEKYTKKKDGWLRAIELFNEISERVKPYGMRVGYHNHSIEFQKINGEILWDIFFEKVDEDVVMQLDTGNAMHAGVDPVEVLKKYPKRVKTIHLKEYPFSARSIGEGIIKWKEIFEICETFREAEWYIVEYETSNVSLWESLKLCLENLRKMGK
jgi:sugar phosphate isomerase/epimerase